MGETRKENCFVIKQNEHDMNKQNLYLDVDDTIIGSNDQIHRMLFKHLNIDKSLKSQKWNFSDICPNITDEIIYKFFESDEFFQNVEVFDNFVDTINELSEFYNIIFVTVGTEENLSKKKKLLNKVLGDISYEFKGISADINKKSHIDMSNGIFIDDRANMLQNSNAKLKILIKNYRNYSWQQTNPCEDIYIVNNWYEIYDILKFNKENNYGL